jgi:hypothetical protein
VVEREWTLRPDALESRRAQAPFRFSPVEGERLDLAGGAIRVLPIGGIGSETAVMVWLPEAGFLWAGDYVQDSDAPTTYAREVWRAARRAGIAPDRFAAQHHPLSEWEKLEALFGGG